jgi:hypothetical protein
MTTTITEIVTTAEAIAARFYYDRQCLENEDGDDIISVCKAKAVTITTVRSDSLFVFGDGSAILVADGIAWGIAVQEDDGVRTTGCSPAEE